MLQEACYTWQRKINILRPIVNSVLGELNFNNEFYQLEQSQLHKLIPCKDSLQACELELREAIECLDLLLKNDEDMLGLLLTERRKLVEQDMSSDELDPELHAGVELLLEDFSRQLKSSLQEVAYLQKKIQYKQELAAMALDASRTRMLRLNTQLTIGGVSLAF